MAAGKSSPRAAERILEVARNLFYRRGIRAIGVDEIVRRAGVTKPSLYRSFSSKDELAASYLRLYEVEFWKRFDASVAAHPGEPRKQILEFLARIGTRAVMPDYRGCGMTNAAIEYPEIGHPARLVGEANKRELRRRLRAMAAEMGAHDPDMLGDGLLLLIEGAYVSGQLFGSGGPAASIAANADRLIEASLQR
ncbi:MAG: helix-turn-helix domain-containing protein [Pseudaminobacter sp.]